MLVSPVSFTADMQVALNSKHAATILLKPTQRLLVLKDNSVSSISRLDIKKISEQLITGGIILMSSKDGSEQKVAKIDKLKVVRRHDEQVLKLWISNDDFSGKGQFANETLNYTELEDKKEMNIVILRQCQVIRARCPGNRSCQLVTSCT
jgi:hypothetical protein